jgi:hypothetical protein
VADELVPPQGEVVRPETPLGDPYDRVTVVNETELPDQAVLDVVRDHFVENASMAWGRATSFQNYAGTGSMLTRREYRTPTNVIDEIKLARDLAERDDDVGAVMGQMLATAFADGMQNFHEDERTVGVFNACAREANLDFALKEMYREYLISSQLVTATLFTRDNLEWTPVEGRTRSESVAVPLIGVLPAENIRCLGDDTFGTAELAYDPDDPNLRSWLETFFSDRTSPAKKAEMGRQNRVAANMFTGRVGQDELNPYEDSAYRSGDLYRLNPRMVHRSTMPKGNWAYPRPLLTRNFALLEAKRLLNILDFALLQGGSNFIVVVKKGSDQMPARPEEITNLKTVVRAASKTGVIVGDHRLSIDVITPDLKELLNPEKRRLLGRKLAMAMLRVAEAGVEEPGVEGMRVETEMYAKVVTSDRHDIKRHVERFIYAETVRRNKRIFPRGAPKIWFPKIILQGTQYFNDLVLKLLDRGDIPRKWAVEAAGFDWEAGVQQRQREIDAGADEVMEPPFVPHSSPDSGPQDNGPGRPRGGADDRPRQTIRQTPGETIRAYYDETAEQVVRVGQITQDILDQYPEWSVGRITAFEREALEADEPLVRGGLAGVPVNREIKVTEEKAVRLRAGLSMIVGTRVTDGALVAKLVTFREPEFSLADAENAVARWGWPIPGLLAAAALDSPNAPGEERAVAPAPAIPAIHVEVVQGRVKRIVQRDDEGNIIGSEEVPVEE